jgi:DNA-binding beta-propeller fold protein YncE
MRLRVALVVGLGAITSLGSYGFAQNDTGSQPKLRMLKTIARQEGDARLAFASIDNATRRLYVARFFGVTAIDLDSGHMTRQLVAGNHVHAAIALPGGRALSTNGDANTATLFDAGSGEVIAELNTGKDPDAATFDSSSGLVFVMDHQEGDITLIDPNAAKVVGRLAVGGALESAVADGRGHLFVNVRDQNTMAVVDTAARKVLRRHDLPGCEGPTALGGDLETGILVAACGNRTALGIRASDGTIVAPRLRIDRKCDAVMFDALRRNFYIPCGRDGTLVVISETKEGTLAVQSSVATAVGAHTGALDPQTGRIYLPTADYHLTFGGIAPADGTFRILVLGFEPATGTPH